MLKLLDESLRIGDVLDRKRQGKTEESSRFGGDWGDTTTNCLVGSWIGSLNRKTVLVEKKLKSK